MRATGPAFGLALVGLLGFWTGSASAASRSWVSGTGDDGASCALTAPCKTWAGAISKTDAGGEIDALDPGGFGALTITKAITIDGGGGQIASVLVSGGINGIVVQAGATDVVTLRNLQINGVGSGLNGIRFLSGAALHIENCAVFGFTNDGLDIFPNTASEVFITHSTITNNLAGVQVRSNGSGNVSAALDWVAINGNVNVGLRADGTGGTGQIHITLSESQVGGGNSNGINAVSGPGAVIVAINRAAITNNGANGLQANAAGGSSATIVIGSSTISGNNVAANLVSGGVINTYQNNEVNGNIASNGTFSGPVGLQ